MIDAVDVLEFSDETGKRAVYEEFSFHDLGGGSVTVRNDSHGDDAEAHEYAVHVVGGIPSDCECPADQYHDGACKHRVAVALRPAILEAAEADQAEPVLATDGGGVPEHLTVMQSITGDDVYHCQTCGGEGDSPDDVDHHKKCPELEGSA